MRLLLMLVSLMTGLCLAQATTTTTTTTAVSTTTPPCWMEAFPPPNSTKTGNELTCEVCTAIFQGLDDTLLGNEEQVTDFRCNPFYLTTKTCRSCMLWRICAKDFLGFLRFVNVIEFY